MNEAAVVLPLLPRYGEVYVTQYLNPSGQVAAAGQHDWRVGAIVGGLLAIFSLMQFVVAPAWGRLSDRIGRRPVLLVGLGGSVVFYALLGFATDYANGVNAQPTPIDELLRLIAASASAFSTALSAALEALPSAPIATTGTQLGFD